MTFSLSLLEQSLLVRIRSLSLLSRSLSLSSVALSHAFSEIDDQSATMTIKYARILVIFFIPLSKPNLGLHDVSYVNGLAIIYDLLSWLMMIFMGFCLTEFVGILFEFFGIWLSFFSRMWVLFASLIIKITTRLGFYLFGILGIRAFRFFRQSEFNLCSITNSHILHTHLKIQRLCDGGGAIFVMVSKFLCLAVFFFFEMVLHNW